MDIREFLAQPLVARVAVIGTEGQPTIRPVWFLFEDNSFWWLTGSSYSQLEDLLATDPRVSLLVDTLNRPRSGDGSEATGGYGHACTEEVSERAA